MKAWMRPFGWNLTGPRAPTVSHLQTPSVEGVRHSHDPHSLAAGGGWESAADSTAGSRLDGLSVRELFEACDIPANSEGDLELRAKLLPGLRR